MNHLVYDEETHVSLEDLDRLARVISMESDAAAGYMIDPRRRLSQFFSGAVTFFKKVKVESLTNIFPGSNDLTAIVNRDGFTATSTKKVIVPEGFVGQWVPYTQALHDAMSRAVQLETSVKSFGVSVGQVINDTSLLQSATGMGLTHPIDHGVAQAVIKINNDFFDPGARHIERDLGAVIERPQDIHTAQRTLQEIIKKDKANPAKKVVDAIDRVMKHIDLLVKVIETDRSVSKQLIEDVVGNTLTLAKEVESYGVLLMRVRQFSESLKDSVKAIKK